MKAVVNPSQDQIDQILKDAPYVVGMQPEPGSESLITVPMDNIQMAQMRETIIGDKPECLPGFDIAMKECELTGLGDFVYGDNYMVVSNDLAKVRKHIDLLKVKH